MDREMMMFHKNALLGTALAEPLCAEYKDLWRGCGDDKEKMMCLALRQQSIPYLVSFCQRGVGLSKEYLKENFADYINGNRIFRDVEGVEGFTYQMFVDFGNDFPIIADVTNIMWCKDSLILIPKTRAPFLYVSNGSDLLVELGGYNSPVIYLFDNSKITILGADKNSNVTVYRYSRDAQVVIDKYCLANVKVFDKELRL